MRYACGHSDDEADVLMAAELARLNARLRGLVVDFFCAECGRRCTVEADWEQRPVCCDWEMIDLPFTARRG